MERIEKIIKWGWLSVPAMFFGWVLIAVQAIGVFGIGVLMLAYSDEKIDEFKYPWTYYSMRASILIGALLQNAIWCLWAFGWDGVGYKPLFYDFLSEFTILHWICLI